MDTAELFRESIKTFLHVQGVKRLVSLGVQRQDWPVFLSEELMQ
jgi:hypothetical protein